MRSALLSSIQVRCGKDAALIFSRLRLKTMLGQIADLDGVPLDLKMSFAGWWHGRLINTERWCIFLSLRVSIRALQPQGVCRFVSGSGRDRDETVVRLQVNWLNISGDSISVRADAGELF